MTGIRLEPTQAGPYIRDLRVPEPEWPLRPAELRRSRVPPGLRGRLVGAALLAWTAGLVLATYSLVRQAGAEPLAQELIRLR